MTLLDSLKSVDIYQIYLQFWWIIDFVVFGIIFTEVVRIALKKTQRYEGQEPRLAKTLGIALSLSLVLVSAQFGIEEFLEIKLRLFASFAGLIIAFFLFFIFKDLLSTVIPEDRKALPYVISGIVCFILFATSFAGLISASEFGNAVMQVLAILVDVLILLLIGAIIYWIVGYYGEKESGTNFKTENVKNIINEEKLLEKVNAEFEKNKKSLESEGVKISNFFEHAISEINRQIDKNLASIETLKEELKDLREEKKNAEKKGDTKETKKLAAEEKSSTKQLEGIKGENDKLNASKTEISEDQKQLDNLIAKIQKSLKYLNEEFKGLEVFKQSLEEVSREDKTLTAAGKAQLISNLISGDLHDLINKVIGVKKEIEEEISYAEKLISELKTIVRKLTDTGTIHNKKTIENSLEIFEKNLEEIKLVLKDAVNAHSKIKQK